MFSRSAATILLVDDEPAVRELILTVLEGSGYHVVVAGDGLEALEKARQLEGPIDLLLTDITMPRLSGFELATLLKSEQPRMRVLLISGMVARPLQIQKGWEFLRKPFRLDTLIEIVQQLLDDGDRRATSAGE